MNKITIQNRLREILKSKQWTEEILEEKSGVSQSTINRLLNAGIESPRLSTLVKISDALNININDLTDSSETKETSRNTPETLDPSAPAQPFQAAQTIKILEHAINSKMLTQKDIEHIYNTIVLLHNKNKTAELNTSEKGTPPLKDLDHLKI